MSASDLPHRLLAALTCRDDERRGHPLDDPTADHLAVSAGGPLLQRIWHRARALPEGEQRLATVRTVLGATRAATIGLCGVSALAGAGAAAMALSAPVVSVPLLLVTLVGINLLSLLLWLLLSVAGGQPQAWLGALWRRLAAWLSGTGSHRSNGVPPLHADLAGLLLAPPLGRWWLASVAHAAWLSYALSGAITLTVLLSLRDVPLSWQTTLLDPNTLQRWAQWLSWLPHQMGLPKADDLPLAGTLDAAARRAWAAWLVVAVAVYGALPRALALVVCGAFAWRAQYRIGRDLDRPGYARLRTRLMPDHRDGGVCDPAPNTDQIAAPARAVVPAPPALPHTVYAAALEWPDATPDPGWHWLGALTESDALNAASRAAPPDAVLLVLVRAAATPDRGIERSVAARVAASAIPVWLVLDALPELAARGSVVQRQRFADWQDLASRAGVPLRLRTPQGLTALPDPDDAP